MIGKPISRKEAIEHVNQVYMEAEQKRQEFREREARLYFGEDCERCKELENELTLLKEKYEKLDREHYNLKVQYTSLWSEYDSVHTRLNMLIHLSNWKDVSVDFKLKEE